MELYGWEEPNMSEKETKFSEEHKRKISEAMKRKHAEKKAQKADEAEAEAEAESSAMIVKIFNDSNNDLPSYATAGSSGLDLRASKKIEIFPNTSRLVMTGLYVEIPIGYELQIRPRSGLALKHMMTVLNSPGTIDSDYRGEIGVIMMNHHPTNIYTIEVGDKIAQAVLGKVETVEWQNIESLDTLQKTERSHGGFGSTG